MREAAQNVINFNTRQQRINMSCRRDEEDYTVRIQTARKALIETLIILNATKCNSGLVISMLVKPFVLYSVLYSQMLPVKKKIKVIIIWQKQFEALDATRWQNPCMYSVDVFLCLDYSSEYVENTPQL